MAPDGFEKRATYERVALQVGSLLDGLNDPIAAMSSVACVVHEALPYASWTGFYRVVAPELLRVGPYQGGVGCLEIPFGRGVCGACAARGATILVDDVHAFEGHIACDPAARSEIVLPVRDVDGTLVAVMDVDSTEPAAFDAHDRAGLEQVVSLLSSSFTTPGRS